MGQYVSFSMSTDFRIYLPLRTKSSRHTEGRGIGYRVALFRRFAIDKRII